MWLNFLIIHYLPVNIGSFSKTAPAHKAKTTKTWLENNVPEFICMSDFLQELRFELVELPALADIRRKNLRKAPS